PLSKSILDAPDLVNTSTDHKEWTPFEREQFHRTLMQARRWEVNYADGFIKSPHCKGVTLNPTKICDDCMAVAKDESIRRAIRLKNREAALPHDERVQLLEQRQKYLRNDHLLSFEHQSLQRMLEDPIIFNIYQSMKSGKPEDCFLQLADQCRSGKLQSFERLREICEVVGDRIRRDSSNNPDLTFGMRYTQSYLDFMTAMRGYGPSSNTQYAILAAELCAPSVRHLRSLVTNSNDALQNPYLLYENIARIKRYLDSVGYTGPIIIGCDCTKVRKRLHFSTQLGAHVLGTTLPLEEVEVDTVEDIDEIVDRVTKAKAHASQVRAIIAKIPLPGCPPIVIALVPTNGKESGADIHTQHLELQKMAANAKISIIALAADGASTEVLAQHLMDSEQSQEPSLRYTYPLYGINLEAPVFKITGPLISITFTDPPHARKTAWNQPQYGTHTASLGTGYLVNRSLVDLQRLGTSGLMVRDVENVDKQDDGAARRVFHSLALQAMMIPGEGPLPARIRPGFEGIMVYFFVYPSTPFCIWLIGTDFVEHFFGIARQFLPNFSYSEFIKMAQHIMVRQRILESGTLKSKRERTSASGYIFEPDTDMRKKGKKDGEEGYIPIPPANLSRITLNELVKLAYNEATHLCRDILSIPVPALNIAKPLILHPLGAPPSQPKQKKGPIPGPEVESDSD
ncbi:hypothetical protein BDN72DRAFT_731006, partial [Pluteus cervinus]